MEVHKKFRKLQIIYLCSLVGLFIPAFGYLMNGISYDANRWCFVLSLLTAITFTLTYDKIFNLEKKEKIILIAEIVLYGILAFAFPSKHIVKYMFFLLLFIIILVFLLQRKWFRENREISSLIIYCLVIVSLGVNGLGFYSSHFNNYTREFLSHKQVISRSSKGPLTMIKDIKDIKDNSFYRVETYGDKSLNESMPLGFHDVSGYFSLMDGDISSYLKDLEVLNQRTAYRFHNLDSRPELDTLASVKYFATINKASAPYGFHLIGKTDTGLHKYYLYQNSNALPLGYTYDNYMLRNDYEKLSALDKQNAMLHAVVLDQSTDYAKASDQNVGSGIEKLNVTVTSDSNVTIQNNKIAVKKAGATITLRFNSKPGSETYIRLNKFNISLKKDVMTDFYVTGDLGVRKKVNVRSPYYNSYFGKENYLINLGYSKKGQSKAVITFLDPMTYNYDNIEAYSVDMSNYADQVKNLNKAVLNNITQSNNTIQGDITLDTKKIMALSIPYSIGWSAYVDGVKQNTLHANIMYTALPMEAGSHHIVLKYETPYLRTGFLVSLASLFILFIVIIYYKKADRKHTQDTERRD